MTIVLFYAVWAYRLVPCRIRGSRIWPGSRGPSSSHMAVDLMMQGVSGLAAVRQAIRDNGGYHPDR